MFQKYNNYLKSFNLKNSIKIHSKDLILGYVDEVYEFVSFSCVIKFFVTVNLINEQI
jgi:hypothetical protein